MDESLAETRQSRSGENCKTGHTLSEKAKFRPTWGRKLGDRAKLTETPRYGDHEGTVGGARSKDGGTLIGLYRQQRCAVEAGNGRHPCAVLLQFPGRLL